MYYTFDKEETAKKFRSKLTNNKIVNKISKEEYCDKNGNDDSFWVVEFELHYDIFVNLIDKVNDLQYGRLENGENKQS